MQSPLFNVARDISYIVKETIYKCCSILDILISFQLLFPLIKIRWLNKITVPIEQWKICLENQDIGSVGSSSGFTLHTTTLSVKQISELSKNVSHALQCNHDSLFEVLFPLRFIIFFIELDKWHKSADPSIMNNSHIK